MNFIENFTKLFYNTLYVQADMMLNMGQCFMKNDNNQVWKMIFLITQIGFTMLVTIFISIAIGYFIDKRFGTRLIGWFVVIGVIAGIRSVYILIRKYLGT